MPVYMLLLLKRGTFVTTNGRSRRRKARTFTQGLVNALFTGRFYALLRLIAQVVIALSLTPKP
jgi:hypothetical protein